MMRRVTIGSLTVLATLAACGGGDGGTVTPPPPPPPPNGVVFVDSIPVAPNYGIHDQYIRDGLDIICAWNTGILIYDVGNGIVGGSPGNPKLVGSTTTAGGEAHNTWWFHNPNTNEKKYLFVGQEGPGSIGSSSVGDIHVLDVSDLTKPTEVATFHRNGSGTHNFWMDEPNQVLYAAYYNGGVVAIDVSATLSGDISSRMIDTLTFGANNTYTWGVQLYQGSLYAIDMLSGFWQLRDSAAFLSVAAGGNNQTERFGSDLWVANGYGYTGTWGFAQRVSGVVGNALKIWKIDATGAPALVDSIITPNVLTVSDVEVTDDNKLLMFSTEGGPNSGFWFYKLTDPAHPTYVAKYLVGSGIHTATFSRINGKLYAFGARDPGNPAQIILDVSALDQ